MKVTTTCYGVEMICNDGRYVLCSGSGAEYKLFWKRKDAVAWKRELAEKTSIKGRVVKVTAAYEWSHNHDRTRFSR